jgi:hypothetical protein
MAKNKKNLFVYTSGIFGKYLLRGLVYVTENLIAFIGFIAITAVFAAIGYVFGLTTAGIVATATAVTASTPILAQFAVFAIPLAASEIIKKIYKDNLEWLVIAYKGLIIKLFTPDPESFNITPEELAVKRAKHEHEPKKAAKYATPESYVTAKKEEYKLENLNKKSPKHPELEVAGRASKRTFKAAAVRVSEGLYWLATMPSRVCSTKSAQIEPVIVPTRAPSSFFKMKIE